MSEILFERAVEVLSSADETFRWHLNPGALRRLLPPFETARVESGSGPEDPLRAGDRTVISVGIGPARLRWTAEIVELDEDERFFVDVQRGGPFRAWRHRHAVGPTDRGSALLDSVRYALPLGGLGALVAGRSIEKRLDRMFAWRHRTMVHDLAAHGRARDAGFEGRTVAITGASGLVGRSLAAFLRTGGHRVLELVRREPRAPHEVRWDPAAGTVDAAALEGIDGLVHLAGESIFGLRWSDAKKARIVESRVKGTRAIVRAVAGMQRPPRVCVFASAIGYYGARGDEVLTEDSTLGTGFLAETCDAWEAEVRALPDAVREVRTRLGVVLDPGGGALRTMLPAFKAGGGGRLGDGKQWFPWIALDDVVGAMHRALHDDGLRGPVNLVAPGEVQNAAFTKALGRTLRRPTIVPVPRFALKAAIGGEQASELLLASTRVKPQRLLDAGFPFAHPDLDGALAHALGRSTQVPGRVDPDTLRTLRGSAPA